VYVAGLCHDGEAVDCDAAGHASWASHWRRTIHFDEYDVMPVARDRAYRDPMLFSDLNRAVLAMSLIWLALSYRFFISN
jgi:hypothetical protein